ncbi:hypothetical protein AB835_02185 [Candidatus Endobugula sertula]|uniref:Methyltransferase FkbM domain-containing protein n=1 Tax=Candidatus Endobugula sertula TaxID=62101 RepID=A0A1D2QT24_9GAMM|nr:hypothetical protein AB835_02185 [Candidatus Endobugula sertula]
MPSMRQRLTSLITRRYPFYSGCASVANSTLVRVIGGRESGSVWSKVSGGEVLADLDDYVGRAAFFMGDLDRKITWISRQIIREGDTVFDIGANIGIVTVTLSDLVGSTGVVHSFEPNPLLAKQLLETIEHNQSTNIKLHPVALGAKKDTLELVVPKGNRGAASLVRNAVGDHCDKVEVQVAVLDELCQQEQIQAVRLVKIDVEGYEADVLAGASQLLSTIQPDAILFELNERTSDQLLEEPVMQLLQGHGYGFFIIPKNIMRMKLYPLNENIHRDDVGHDFLAVPKGEKFNEIARLVKAVI